MRAGVIAGFEERRATFCGWFLRKGRTGLGENWWMTPELLTRYRLLEWPVALSGGFEEGVPEAAGGGSSSPLYRSTFASSVAGIRDTFAGVRG